MTTFLIFESFKRSSKPNNYLIAPEGLCRNSTPDAISPVIAASPDEVFSNLVEMFKATKGWRDLEYDQKSRNLSVVAVTRLLRCKDDVDIRVLPADEGSTQLAIYSRSRVGHSDLGANKKRVQSLLDHFTGRD